ncbi:hypothetical protein CEXT_458611 [Caerostris extrusa]|uniref:Uncharacterized protein n=1 Tax=Caerostris extrusa TaxID=172846 RepID=A0AAV4XG67_CAEEX|nr:hypothetical protein CEXT_458611 [Caerostris extrusa]
MKFKFDDDYSPKHSSSTLVPSLTPCNFPCNFLFNETLLPPEAWIALQDGPGIYFKQTNKQTCEGPCHVIISEDATTPNTHSPLPPTPASFSPLITEATKIFPSFINIFPLNVPSST